MRSIQEKKEIIDQALIKHGPHTYTWTPEIGALMDVACNAVDWAERARAWLAVQLDAGDYTPSQYEDLKKLLEELPE